MDKFSIEYLTATSGTASGNPVNMAQIMFSLHDGVMAKDGANYLNSSLHLEDVYNVINSDVEKSRRESAPKYNSIGKTAKYATGYHAPIGTSKLVIGETDASSRIQRQTTVTDSVTLTGSRDVETLERGTPSPCRDSGIESDTSPISATDVDKALKTLDKKASKVAPKKKPSKSDEKPGESYITLIARAILSSRDTKMTLGDIYKHIAENHSYYNNEERAWRNSIRYNLSINECFVKAGKEETGKGNYWTIHENCLDDFRRGDFRRRQARRRAKRNVKSLQEPSLAKVGPPNVKAYTPMTATYPEYTYPTMPVFLPDGQSQQTTSYSVYPERLKVTPTGLYYNEAAGQQPFTNFSPISVPDMSHPFYSYLQANAPNSHHGYYPSSHSIPSRPSNPNANGGTLHDVTHTWYNTQDYTAQRTEDIPECNKILIE